MVATLHKSEQNLCVGRDRTQLKGRILEFIGKVLDEAVAGLDLLFQRDALLIGRLEGHSEDPREIS